LASYIRPVMQLRVISPPVTASYLPPDCVIRPDVLALQVNFNGPSILLTETDDVTEMRVVSAWNWRF